MGFLSARRVPQVPSYRLMEVYGKPEVDSKLSFSSRSDWRLSKCSTGVRPTLHPGGARSGAGQAFRGMNVPGNVRRLGGGGKPALVFHEAAA